MVNWAKIKKDSKYRNVKTTVDGFTFDSKKEAVYYRQLKLLLAAGKIRDLDLQPRFELQPGYRAPGGVWIRPITYVADFRYVEAENNQEVVVDVKSRITEQNPVYRLKRKLLLYRYPKIKFVEVL